MRQFDLLFQSFFGFSTFFFLIPLFFPRLLSLFFLFLSAFSLHRPSHVVARGSPAPLGPGRPRLAPTPGAAFLLATSDARGAANGRRRGAALGHGEPGSPAQPARRGARWRAPGAACAPAASPSPGCCCAARPAATPQVSRAPPGRAGGGCAAGAEGP